MFSPIRCMRILTICASDRPVRIRSHGSNTTRNSDVSNFRKLRTPTFSEIFVLCNHSHFMPSPFTGDSVRSS